MRRLLWLSLVAGVSSAACGDDGAVGGGATGGANAGGDATGGTGGAGGSPSAIEWQPCSAYLEVPPTEDTEVAPAECAMVEVPLFWSRPDGATIELFVKRIPAERQPAARHLWMLNGGPGAPSLELEPVLVEWSQRDPDLEIYTTDFRGVGMSTPLPCSDTLTVLNPAACAASVEEEIGSLDGFTTTQAALDVVELVSRTRGDADVTVYGVSYGTFWAQRLLQVAPDLVAGVVLDSIVPPDADWTQYSPNAETVAQSFFAECAADAFCASKLGPDPWSAVQAYFATPAAEACASGIGASKDVMQRVLVQAIRKVETRPVVPALIYRLNRCAPEDEQAIANLLAFLSMQPAEGDAAIDAPIYYHIVMSELWPAESLSVEEYEALDATLLIAPGGTGDFRQLWEHWPLTSLDEYAGGIASTASPVLMLQGGLDPQTPDSAAVTTTDALTAAGHTLLHFPLAPHGVIHSSPTASDPDVQCGTEAVLAFVADKSATSPACMSDLAPIDFGDNPEIAELVFQQGSIWEASAQATWSEARSRAAKRALRALAHDVAHGPR